MLKYVSNVRFKVSSGKQEEMLELHKNFNISDFEGALSFHLVDCGEDRFFSTIVWENENSLVEARPALIAFLDKCRPILDEITPELGVTDPLSGKIIFEV